MLELMLLGGGMLFREIFGFLFISIYKDILVKMQDYPRAYKLSF